MSHEHYTPVARPTTGIPAVLVIVTLAGFLLAILGTYWDDAWHTDKGRDSFLVAPHIALYAGITLAGGALSFWALRIVREDGLAAIRYQPSLLLAVLGVTVTLGAAPIDNGWHIAFGRDAVLWSPPHMLGVAGTMAIAAALLLELSSQRRPGFRLAAIVAGAGVLAAGAVPVLEYETDVPQFDLVYYLPVLCAGSAFALALVRRTLVGRWSASLVTVAYTAIMAVIATILAANAMPAPLIPLLIIPAVGFDLMDRRRIPVPAKAAGYVAIIFAVYVPYLNWIRSDLFLDAGDVLIGFPLAVFASFASLSLAGLTDRRRPRPESFAVAMVIATLAVPAAAMAHDPGQGEEQGTADLVARTSGELGSLTVSLDGPDHCLDFRPERLTARRAGTELSAPLQRTAPCDFQGQIALPNRGRWFLYAEIEHDGQQIETWLPIQSGRSEVRREDNRSVYLPPALEGSVVKLVSGLVMYGAFVAIIVAIPLIYRRRISPTTPTASSPTTNS